ncbi:energy-dependent translational throttle protein EttA [Stenotrophobium rhamnosiphilum]|uniref:Energy-dependent translational throttle protein EttA n=1 Tax=Stenotrophobium rhamnosiphilum TaxID=2029166 RepID=A0A2T5MKQ6_9GAMM|nr:energy-dependent translational throttle protein EttA [Stenotrophobium rhamnosiphilum]PTU33155.1 energy-dependent translational throttle protein EttA [Stenotrophobium rhamnosiphilum]
MSQYVFTMNKCGKIVPPKKEILRNISLSFFPGAKIGVLGYNGAGKSTLLKIMAGIDKDFVGEARPQPGLKMGYLPQEPQLDPTKNVRQNVEEAMSDITNAQAELDQVYAAYAEPDADFDKLSARQQELEAILAASDGHNIDVILDKAAEALNLPPWDADVTKLSGGERRRVALCRLLLSKPDMLLLDEPTNHLDAESVAWLEKFLKDFPGTIIAVTHDRYFLDNVAGWILELDRGTGIPWQGNYTNWLEQKTKRLSEESNKEDARQKALNEELEWVRKNPKGRQAKSKARIKAFEELSSQEYQSRSETKELYIPPGPRLGDIVIEVKDLGKKFGDRQLYSGVNFTVPRGAIVGIVGANGMGKTTLFRILTGQDSDYQGEVTVGETVKFAYVDQSRDSLNGDNTVFQEIAEGNDMLQIGNFSMPARAYIGRFNFKGESQQKRVKELSGGERNRVHLAKLLLTGGNVVLLDEPTNDLDVETLRSLEEAILDFPGCALVISHDRWFLDRVATHILAFEDSGEVIWHEGNYRDYEDDFRRRTGNEPGVNRRTRHKKLA